MHPRVLSPESWDLTRRVAASGLLDGWTLAGGTALALQLGHRVSEDLDFFRAGPFEERHLIDRLARHGSLAVQSRSGGTLHCLLDGLRIGFLQAEAPLLFPTLDYRDIEIADPRDIAMMKLVAIGGRGSRKDFVDLYFYLRATDGLDALFSMLRRRFESVDYNEYHLLKSVVFFADAEAEPMPQMLRPVAWEEVKSFLVAEAKRLSL